MQLGNETQQEIMIDFKKYWKVISKYKWKVIAFTLCSSMLVAIYVSSLTPVYRATSSLLINASQDHTVSIDSVYSLDTSRSEYFLTQYEILKSRSVSEKVIDELTLTSNAEFLENKKSFIAAQAEEMGNYLNSFLLTTKLPIKEDTDSIKRSEKLKLIEIFQEKLTITPIRKTQIVNISFDATDPKMAALVANTVGEVYIRQEMLAQLDVTQKAVDWLKKRLEQLRSNLTASMSNLQSYRIAENLIDIESKGVKSIASDELESLTASYLAAKKARFEAETIFLFVRNAQDNNLDSLLALPEIRDHPLIEAIKSVEIEAEKKVSEFSFRYGKKHPKSISAKAELAAVRESLQQRANKLVQGIEKALKAAKDNERRFAKELEMGKIKFQAITDKEQKYLRLQREVEANSKLYGTFLSRYKEMESTNDLEVQQARIIDFAEVPYIPNEPKVQLIILTAFILSLIFAIASTLAFDSMNDKLRTPNDVESKLGMPLLGLLPIIWMKRKHQPSLHAYFEKENIGFAEAVRTMRTALVLSHFENKNKVILITSSVPNEGKTTTALNIGFALVQMKKTLLIEGDMRRPSFTKMFNLRPYQKGLSNIISGTEELDNVIIKDQQSGLDIIPAGFIPSNPLELLSSKGFTDLLARLKIKYDYVLIDSPPTQAVSDALVLAKEADSVIYVVRSEMTNQETVRKGLSRLLKVDAKIDGVVLNRVNINKTRQEDGYEGYYDYYGYGKSNK